MKIELVNALPELEADYRKEVQLLVDKEIITLEEWNTKYKDYRDDCGYSILHYFSAYLNNIEVFVTLNPIMLENRDELVNKFKVRILTLEETFKEEEEKKDGK